jgi:hypothetical protein
MAWNVIHSRITLKFLLYQKNNIILLQNFAFFLLCLEGQSLLLTARTEVSIGPNKRMEHFAFIQTIYDLQAVTVLKPLI